MQDTPPFAAPLPSKLVRPDLRDIYGRTRLFDRLNNMEHSSGIWVSGPAGSGKTTLVNSYLEHEKRPVLWYDIDESDADIASFFYYLGLGAAPHFMDDALRPPLLTPEYLPGALIFTRRFFELLCANVEPHLAIVLDNYQLVREESPLHEVLCTAIDSLCPGFSLFVCSRVDPPAEMARSRSNCSLQMIGWKQLQLVQEEARAIVACTGFDEYPTEVVDALHHKTDGWVTGLMLLLRRGEFEDIEPHQLATHTPSEMFDYFGSVTFQGLDRDEQRVLLSLCYLPRISEAAAKALAGDDAPRILEGLHKKNAFIYRFLGKELYFASHPLFQEFLQAKSRETFSRQELADVLMDSAGALAKEGRIEDAVELCLKGGHIHEAVGMILEQAPTLAAQGRFQTLHEWIDKLPEEVSATVPWIPFWKGACITPYNPVQARPYVLNALKAFEAQPDPVGCFMALSGILDSYTYEFEDFSQMDQYIDKYYAYLEKWGDIQLPPEIRVRVVASLSNALIIRRPDSPETAEMSEQAWELLHALKDVNITLQIFLALLTNKLFEGNLAASGHLLNIFKQASQDKSSHLAYLVLQDMLALQGWMEGDFASCLEAVERGIQAEKETGIMAMYLGLRTHGAAANIGLGDLDKAREYLDQITPFLDREGAWMQSLYHIICFWLELRQGNLAAMRFHSEEYKAKTLRAGFVQTESPIHSLFAVLLHLEGEHEQARAELRKALDGCKRIRTLQFEFMNLLIRAWIALDTSDEEDLGPALAHAFAMGREWNFRFTYFWQPEVMARLCMEALRRGLETSYVKSLVWEHDLIPEDPPFDVEEWPWPVRVTTLGRFSLEVQGEPVTFSRKTQQRPLSLLKLLLARGGEGVSSTQVQDALWPDAEGDAAKNAFSTALHRLRKLLGQTKALKLEGGILSLDPNLVWTDIQAFETHCKRIERQLASRPDALNEEDLLHELRSLKTDPFLPNEPGSWAMPMRERIRSRTASIAKQVGEFMERADRPEAAEDCYGRALAADPLDEETYRKLITTLARLGRNSEALQYCELCRENLKSQLGVAPSAKLDKLERGLLVNSRPR